MNIVLPGCQLARLNPNSNLVFFKTGLGLFLWHCLQSLFTNPKSKAYYKFLKLPFFPENKLAKYIAQLTLFFIYVFPIIGKSLQAELSTFLIHSTDIYIFILSSLDIKESLFCVCLRGENTSCGIPLAVTSKASNQLEKQGIRPIWGTQ